MSFLLPDVSKIGLGRNVADKAVYSVRQRQKKEKPTTKIAIEEM